MKELDKFVKNFSIKCMQVIVQSRFPNRNQSLNNKPDSGAGYDWFNINIADIPEVKAAYDFDKLTVKSSWRICCEISLRSSDSGRVVLEHWIISNRCLQSEIRPSASCFSISPGNLPASNNDPSTTTSSTSNSGYSPSSNSLSSRHHHQQQHHHGSPGSAEARILAKPSLYNVYNRMSLLLKTIMTTSHIIPAYKLACEVNPLENYEMSYRIYNLAGPVSSSTSSSSPSTSSTTALQNQQHQSAKPAIVTNTRGSFEDVNCVHHPSLLDSPGKRSTQSANSLNIRDLIGSSELDDFGPIMKIGSIKTDVNEIDVSLCYRADVRSSFRNIKSSRIERATYGNLLGQDCIVAAKQLLAGGNSYSSENHGDSAVCDESAAIIDDGNGSKNILDQPIRPPFANGHSQTSGDPNFELIEPAFEKLLNMSIVENNNSTSRHEDKNGNSQAYKSKQSQPIQVPTSQKVLHRSKLHDNSNKASCESTPKSLLDSYVFLELNPPFASDEQNDFNAFFQGPAPNFVQGYDCLKDAEDLKSQFAKIEADALQIDEFVDNVCVLEDEEND